MFDCNDILSMTNKHFVASGWTKAVYRGDLKNQSYAIKTVSLTFDQKKLNLIFTLEINCIT
jgi:hypothetical protein